MGNDEGCIEGCYSWFKGYTPTIENLRKHFRKNYKNSIFYEECMNFLEQAHLSTKAGYQISTCIEGVKHSLIESIDHYDEDAISLHCESETSQSLPNSLSTLTEEQKNNLVTDLINRSYILLDISDTFSNETDSKVYEDQVRARMFENEQSMMTESFIGNPAIHSNPKDLSPSIIAKLENYVKLCENIKKNFENDSNSVLSSFLLSLKSRIIERYNTSQERGNTRLNNLLINTRVSIELLISTIIIIFGISFDCNDEDGQSINFVNEINISTLSTCILFSDGKLQSFYEEAIFSTFEERINLWKQQSAVSDRTLISRILGNHDMIHYFQPTITTLFEARTESSDYFDKTLKIFEKISKNLEPVLKLKLFGELEKQFKKDLDKLSKEQSTEIVYDREKALILANWLMNRDKSKGKNNIPSIILAYCFIHEAYRLRGPGSSLINFVEIVQNIFNWEIPTF